MSKSLLDLEPGIRNLDTVSNMIAESIDGAIAGDKDAIAALYYLVGCLTDEAEELVTDFYQAHESQSHRPK